jgi:signal transduction histidine kinase
MINLISNAIKFSKPLDKITISISKNSGDKVVFCVTDQGMGMNEADRKNLFKPYFKSTCEKSRHANTNSNGIGLSFCKKLAKCLGGDLRLSESYRDGCQFILELHIKSSEVTRV